MMTETEELHRLLDEQDIEYREYQPNPFEETTAWDLDVSDIRHEVCASFEEFDSGSTLLKFWNCTPEQAVEATLGRGTCQADETDTWECVCDAIGHYGERMTVHVMECSECGRTYEHVNGPYEYCPHCRARITEVTDG